ALAGPPLPGQLYPALDHLASLLEPAQIAKVPAVLHETVGERAVVHESGPDRGIAVRQFDRTLEDGHPLAVLAGQEEGIGRGGNDHVERGVAGFLGQGDRLASEAGSLAILPVDGGP